MAWARSFWLRLQTFFLRPQIPQRLADEFQFHLDQQIAENIAAGMTPDEARHAAMRTFGNAGYLKEETRESWSWMWLENFLRDLRYAARALARTPAFPIVAILVIALGTGATTTLFTVVRSVLLKPLPFKDPSRLIRLYEHDADGKFPYNVVSGGVFGEWKKQSHGFSDLALLSGDGTEYGLSGTGGQLPEKVRASECTWNLSRILGVEPALGRSFTAADDQPSAAATAILSWGLWKRRFGGDPAILNQTIHLDMKSYTVVGVMPSWFAYPVQATQLWTPIYHEESAETIQALDDHEFIAIGRLKPNTTETQATAELSLIVRRLHDEHRDNPFVSDAANSRPLLEDMVGDVKTPLYVLLAATGCVLLIACLNIANLLVARSATRRRELAIRAALGGSRRRLLGEHLTETFLLSAVAGGVGVLLADAALQWFVATRQDMSRVEAIHVDGVVVAFALGLIFLCALFAGMISSLSVSGDHILSSLQESSRSHSAGPGRVRLRRWLLAVEVALTVVLLIGAGLLLKSYERLRSSNLGCITNNVLTMRFSLPDAKYSQPVRRVNFFEALLERVRALPGVEAAGLGRAVPGSGYWGDGGFLVAEHPSLPLGQAQYAITRWADPEYFAALGIPFLRGQTFDANQRLDKADEVIISESFARQYFGDEDPLGKHLLKFGKRAHKIVGIVGDTRFLIAKPAQPMMYFPLYDGLMSGATLAIRSSRDVTSFALPIQQIVQQLDPELPVSDILTMDQIIGKSTLDASFNATLVLAFAVLSLLLAAVGLFGVLSYIVAQRTTEIGVRVALGAQRSEVLRLMLSDGLRPAGVGLILGLTGGAATSQLFRDLLYGVPPLDASVFAAVTILLLAVASMACLLPAWRASRLDPVQALRNE
jgi:predicted permease